MENRNQDRQKIKLICKITLRMQHQPEAYAPDLGEDQSRYL